MLPSRVRRALACLALLLPAAACSAEPTEDPPEPAPLTGNPFAERPQYLLDVPRLDAAAKQAEADGDTTAAEALTELAAVPTGIWLTPERHPPGEVGPYVASIVADAAGEEVPLFVVYGIPDRDCTGQLSAGGLASEEYGPWVDEIAAAVGDQGVVVLEPDALPGAVQCQGVSDRLSLIERAVGTLAAAGTTTYVDAGHSYWIKPAPMARLLRQVGVDRVRGFSTNVSNYQPTDAELSFANRLSQLLGGAHYVVDTGRNGSATGSSGPVAEWCNPPGRALGTDPGYVDDGSPLDALLWIKPPAESDGSCNGGPPAGDVWVERAVELVTARTS